MSTSKLQAPPTLTLPADAPPQKRWMRKFARPHTTGSQHKSRNPLLNIPIGRRLALGFLMPALIASIALGSTAIQSHLLLSHETTFYQGLVHAYTSLNTAVGDLQQMHTNMLGTLNDAVQPQPSPETLREDQTAVQELETRFNTILETYIQLDLLDQHADLSQLFTAAGHNIQIVQQRALSESALSRGQAYRNAEELVLNAVTTGHISNAHELEFIKAEQPFADAMSTLLTLIQFNGSLVTSVRDATTIEENRLLLVTTLAVLSVLLGIGIVGWLVSSTLVQRLQRLRYVVQSIEQGEVHARLTVVGRDEVADVSASVNSMLDTIVGLLDETKRQRDALANAEELQQLHQELQSKHEALNVANARLEALATTDPLTGLPNHRAVMNRVEEELSRCRRTQEYCAILFVDLDHFKRINDTWGHRAGDAVLQEVGSRLTATLRLEDFVGRYGGEEFSIVLTNTDLSEARQVAERLRIALAEKPCLWETEDENAQSVIAISITGSIGVAVYQDHGITREALIQAADTAMYHAKQSGRNRICVSGEEITFVQNLLAAAPDGLQMPDNIAVQALAAVANAHDRGTSAHSQRMVLLAEATARMLGRSEEEIYLIRLSTLLHDIGKIGIPDAILRKPGPLTEDEWAVMRNHPEIGRQVLVQAGGKFEVLSHIIVAHHERWDGDGYPYGLSQEAIPLGARILSVVDSYDAMTSERPYRPAMSVSEARAELQRCVGRQYDPQVVEAFFRMLDEREQQADLLQVEGQQRELSSSSR